MSTPSKLNPFGFSRLQIIIMLAIPAVLFIILSSWIWVKGDSPCTAPAPMVKHSASANALWERGGFYNANIDFHPPSIVSLNHVVVFIENCNKVVALDGRTGEELWTVRYVGYYHVGLAISPTTVFITDGKDITARDLKTGWYLWSAAAMGRGTSIGIMRIQGDILYAGDGPFYILFDTRTGWVLDKGSAIDGKFPPSDVFPVRELQAINSLYVDAVVGNTLYWGGEGVKARDISNGSELWFSNTYLISPITVTRDSVYAISKNGDLMRFDSATGAAYVKIHFTPAPMAHFFQEDEHDYNNFVSVDPATNVAYVYLGDSQTFTAYQLNP